MTIEQQVLQAFYRSGRPVDVIDPDGWHLVLWNTGAGVVSIGMWHGDQPIHIAGWKRDLDGCDIQPVTSTVKMVLDVIRCIRDENYRIESLVISGYSR